MKKTRGFTLFELILTIAILGVLMAVAIPNFRAMVASNRQVTAANALIASFNAARNEAITRSRPIDITATNKNWKNGWTITAPAQNNVMDLTGNLSMLEAIENPPLSKQDPLSSELIVTALPDEDTGNPPPLVLEYDRQGRLITADGSPMIGSLTITFCDYRTGEMGHQITLEPIGRVSSSTVTCI